MHETRVEWELFESDCAFEQFLNIIAQIKENKKLLDIFFPAESRLIKPF